MKTIRRKMNLSGFTLAETLVAILIMLMVSSIVAAGIPAAVNAFTKAVDAANAQVLLSTTITALRNELGMAQDVKVDGKTVTYFNLDNQNYSTIVSTTSDITLKEFIGIQETSAGTDTPQPKTRDRSLVSDSAKTHGMTVSYTGVTCDSKVITFSDLSVKKGEGDDEVTIASAPSFAIRFISAAPTSSPGS